jgi:hypothetical protein
MFSLRSTRMLRDGLRSISISVAALLGFVSICHAQSATKAQDTGVDPIPPSGQGATIHWTFCCLCCLSTSSRALPAVFSKAESYRSPNEPPMPTPFTALAHVDSVIRLSATRPPLAHLVDTWPTKRSLPSQNPWRYEGDPSGEQA